MLQSTFAPKRVFPLLCGCRFWVFCDNAGCKVAAFRSTPQLDMRFKLSLSRPDKRASLSIQHKPCTGNVRASGGQQLSISWHLSLCFRWGPCSETKSLRGKDLQRAARNQKSCLGPFDAGVDDCGTEVFLPGTIGGAAHCDAEDKAGSGPRVRVWSGFQGLPGFWASA